MLGTEACLAGFGLLAEADRLALADIAVGEAVCSGRWVVWGI